MLPPGLSYQPHSREAVHTRFAYFSHHSTQMKYLRHFYVWSESVVNTSFFFPFKTNWIHRHKRGQTRGKRNKDLLKTRCVFVFSLNVVAMNEFSLGFEWEPFRRERERQR